MKYSVWKQVKDEAYGVHVCYSEIEGSWPMSISSLFMKIHRIDIGIQTRIREDVSVSINS